MTPASRLLLPLLLILAPLCLLAGIGAGSADLSLADVGHALLAGPSGGIAADIVWQLRLPRVLSAFACGGLLALAGVLLQVLLRNPLAEPYILGVSGGASVGALSAMALGAGVATANLGAFAGALASVALLLSLGLGTGPWNAYRLLLTGVVLSAGYGALVSLLLALAPGEGLRGMLFWLMGDLSRAEHPGLVFAALAAALAAASWQARPLDVLALGELKAKSLGVAVNPLQAGLYLLASLCAAAAVAEAGTIGFVGLIVPHFLRLLGLADHRRLLPASVLAGGIFLVLADTLARTLAAPQQLPVGALTALLGVPTLLFLLSERRRAAR